MREMRYTIKLTMTSNRARTGSVAHEYANATSFPATLCSLFATRRVGVGAIECEEGVRSIFHVQYSLIIRSARARLRSVAPRGWRQESWRTDIGRPRAA